VQPLLPYRVYTWTVSKRRQYMKKFSALLTVTAVALAAAATSAAASDHAKAVAAAQAATRPWLALVDAGKYSASWKAASVVFRLGVTEAKWDQSVQSVYKQTGKLRSRTPMHSEFTTSLPGAQGGAYVVVQYSSKFAKVKAATETVVMMLDGGKWKTAGYFVRPE
jgi:hypothetical protein